MSVLKLSIAGFALALAWSPIALAEEAAAPQPAATAAAAEEEDTVVCKKIQDTGSRVRRTKVCKTKSEWNAAEKGAQDTMRGIQQKGVQPGGDSLQPG
ncbi:hypothetical protein sos41_34250 [Alphaproteobacteria bacterium SO-S41]|nr:hypothetical protein sos41_34250 [Alphaproteobacteria bacterium SO-S41]